MNRSERVAICIDTEVMWNRLKLAHPEQMIKDTPDDALPALRNALAEACLILWGDKP